jgi:hypothetical protein
VLGWTGNSWITRELREPRVLVEVPEPPVSTVNRIPRPAFDKQVQLEDGIVSVVQE